MKNTIIKINDISSYIVINNRIFGEKLCLIDNEDIPRITMFKWNVSHVTKRNKTHYVVSQIGGKTISLHRLILSFPLKQIYHIDGSGLNNSKNNLREVTPSENCLNKKVQPNNKIGIKGIQKRVYSKGQVKFRARIRVNRILINLGEADTVDGAVELRKKYEKENLIQFS